jgi:hypothetical protein
MAEVFSILSIERRAATTAIRYPELSQNLKNDVTVKNTSLVREFVFVTAGATVAHHHNIDIPVSSHKRLSLPGRRDRSP